MYAVSINIAQKGGKTQTLLKEAFIGSKNNKSKKAINKNIRKVFAFKREGNKVTKKNIEGLFWSQQCTIY